MRMQTVPVILACAVLGGCTDFGPIEPGPVQALDHEVARGKAKEVEVHIEMPAGELQVSGGGSGADLLKGHFEFTEGFGRPAITYDDGAAGRGTLTVKSAQKSGDGAKARWAMRVAEDISTELHVRMGAGQARLDLGGLDLRGVRLSGGAGDLMLDLRGRPASNYDVHLNGGVGRMRIYVPGQAGVRARVNGGIGGVTTEGDWKKSGREYRTANYDDANRRIEMHINGGIGTINLIADE